MQHFSSSHDTRRRLSLHSYVLYSLDIRDCWVNALVGSVQTYLEISDLEVEFLQAYESIRSLCWDTWYQPPAIAGRAEAKSLEYYRALDLYVVNVLGNWYDLVRLHQRKIHQVGCQEYQDPREVY
jgi:hypothetical protein